MHIVHTIVYAEDDLDDLFIVQQAFEKASDAVHIIHAKNGIEAMEVLEQHHRQHRYPCLVLLDINMPGMNGRETLTCIKEHGHWKNIPVVLFSTSSTPADKSFAQENGAHFFTKPLVYEDMEKLVGIFLQLCTHAEAANA